MGKATMLKEIEHLTISSIYSFYISIKLFGILYFQRSINHGSCDFNVIVSKTIWDLGEKSVVGKFVNIFLKTQ